MLDSKILLSITEPSKNHMLIKKTCIKSFPMFDNNLDFFLKWNIYHFLFKPDIFNNKEFLPFLIYINLNENRSS